VTAGGVGLGSAALDPRNGREHSSHESRIAGKFGPNDRVPPEAIVEAWKVDADGNISGDFINNKNYDPKPWPGPQ